MPIHYQREIDRLRRSIFTLSTIVEGNLQKSIQSMQERDPKLARQVVELDQRVDEMEIDVEEECLKILALHQPVAGDLRALVTMLKINNDLERIGDRARDIAQHVILLCDRPPIEVNFDWADMASKSQIIVQKSMDAVVNTDTTKAFAVCALEDEIDVLCQHACDIIMEQLRQSNEHVDSLLDYWSIAQFLESIADHAKKIAEDVIYTATGTIVRHQTVVDPSEA